MVIAIFLSEYFSFMNVCGKIPVESGIVMGCERGGSKLACYLLLNGPNLNMLAIREPTIYGHTTLATIEAQLTAIAKQWAVELESFQSNYEGELIDRIHGAYGKCEGLICNFGALTHYSYALRDALSTVDIPTVEVHMSNLYKREPFRQMSVIAPVVVGQITGFGVHSYELALRALHQHIISSRNTGLRIVEGVRKDEVLDR